MTRCFNRRKATTLALYTIACFALTSCRFSAKIPSTKFPPVNQAPDTFPSTASLTLSDGPTYDYGSVTVGNTSDKTFTLTNSGTGAATALAGSFSGSQFNFNGNAYPGTGGSCEASLPAETTCTLVLRFAPQSSGAKSDTLTLSYSGGSSTSATRALTGTGLSIASLGISDAGYDYGGISTGNTSDKTFTVTNSGDSTATALAANAFTNTTIYTFAGGTYPGSGGDCGTTLAGSSTTCTINVRFSPSGLGAVNDTISLGYSTGVSSATATRAITGTGTALGPSGALSTSFATDGTFSADLAAASNQTAEAIISQTDGKLLVGGARAATNFIISRLSQSGSLDTSFFTDGSRQGLITQPALNEIRDFALDTTGRIYGATHNPAAGDEAALIRYLTDGAFDTTFMTDGHAVFTGVTNFFSGAAVARQTDGKFIFQSLNLNGVQMRMIFRVCSDGSLDTSFATSGGKGFTCPNAPFAPAAGSIGKIRIGTDGKAVSIGYEASGANTMTSLLRITSDGIADTSFDTNGILSTTLITSGYAVAFDTLGRIIASGMNDAASSHFVLMRFLTDGTIDTTFKTSGKAIYDGAGGPAQAVLSIGSKIVAFGGDTPGVAAVRFMSDGVLDTSFSTSGAKVAFVADSLRIGSNLTIQVTTNNLCGAAYDNFGTAVTGVVCFTP